MNYSKRCKIVLLVVSGCFFCVLPAAGHFEIGTTYRYFVITETENTTEIYVRTPIALLFGDILNGVPDENDFLVNLGSAESPQYYLSMQSVKGARAPFTGRIARSLTWRIGANSVPSRIRSYRILEKAPELHLLTSSAARNSLRKSNIEKDVPIGTGYIDMQVSLASNSITKNLSVHAGLPEIPLPEGVIIQNKIVDERDTNHRAKYMRTGQLNRPLSFSRSVLGRMTEYVYQGILHIFIGVDHVLLIFAMALGAKRLLKLIGMISAFTLGHAVTLLVGFFNLVPQAAWFIPFVEITIAITLVLAAVSSFFKYQGSLLLYIIIGLVHGLGFSFVLGNVLETDTSDLTSALFSFMLGIELAQIAIVLAVLIIFTVIRKIHPMWSNIVKNITLTAVGCVGITLVIQRLSLWSSI